MNLSFYARSVVRETRGARGRLAFFAACLAVGVAAVVAVAGLSAGVYDVLRSEARQLLAADLAVTGHRTLPRELDLAVTGLPGARRADVTELATMASAAAEGAAPGPSLLVELKAVGPGYPFYGALRVEPALPLGRLLDDGSALVAPEVLRRLGLAVGGRLRLGNADFRVAGTVLAEPDRIALSFTLGPRVLVSPGGLARAGLEGFGSRVTHRALIALPPGSDARRVEAAAETLRRALPAGSRFEVETFSGAQPRLRTTVERGTRFLGLVALLSLLVGGLGVAQAVRAWLSDRLDAVAVQRCLGLRPREVVALYLGQTVLVGLAGSAAGAALGSAVLAALFQAASGVLPGLSLRSAAQGGALLRGGALGLSVAVLFSLPTLLAAGRVPPLRVLRRATEPLPASPWARAAVGAALLGGVWAAAAAQSGAALLGAKFTAGLAAVAAVLYGAAWAAARLLGRLPLRALGRVARGRPWLRYGLGAVGRPGSGALGSVVGLGLGVLLVLTAHLVEVGLRDEIGAEMPKDAPSSFLLDIQPDQWPGVESLLRAEGADRLDSVPLVMARLRAVDGRPVEELAAGADRAEGGRGRRKWVLTREQRLTYLDRLPPDNTLVAGRLWSDPARPEVSLEKEFADDLGAGVGSTLRFDVQGVPLDLEVTSLRRVEWRSFGINFFLVVEPGVLEAAPQSRLAAVRLPPDREQGAQDLLTARYPNVTVLRVRDILDKVAAVLSRVGLGVQLLGGFTVVAGMAVLAGAVAAGAARRGREVALLKTLGMTRRGVAAAFALEHALVGLLAGVVGSSGAGVAAWAILTRGMDTPWRFRPGAHLFAVGAAVLLAAVPGLAASSRALRRRPAEVLREE